MGRPRKDQEEVIEETMHENEEVKMEKGEKRGISLKVDDDLYWKFLEWKAKFRVNTNEECVKKLIELAENNK